MLGSDPGIDIDAAAYTTSAKNAPLVHAAFTDLIVDFSRYRADILIIIDATRIKRDVGVQIHYKPLRHSGYFYTSFQAHFIRVPKSDERFEIFSSLEKRQIL